MTHPVTNEAGKDEAPTGEAGASGKAGAALLKPPRRALPPLPGMAAISLYLLALAGVILVGVADGRHYPPLFLIFAAGFMAASAGMMRLRRWAWALALAAVFLLAVYNLWIFSTQHQGPALVQGLLNLVFFLYLVRTEVRKRLR
jgi:peptidoglycan/LPS O-acetylase OafA/YrhL